LFALLLGSTGQTTEAIHEAQKAVDLDPVSATNLYTLAQEAFMARRYDVAISQSLRALELHPGLGSAHNIIARSFAQKGMYPEAVAAFHQWQPNVASSASLPVAYVLALSGKRREAEATIAEWRRLSDQEGRKPLFLPMCYIALGESDRAMDYLDEAFSQHVTNLIWLKVDPEFDALRGNSRFHLLLRKMGLE
jgi:serine/threonine-protein kinase